jgi:hypothetical protein
VRRWLADEASDSVVGGGKWRDWSGPRLRVAAAGYVALAVFCVAAAIALWLGSSIAVAAGVGALFAAPLVIALAGERITGIKGFGVEISLEKVTVDIAAISPGSATVAMHTEGVESVMDTQGWEPHLSAAYVPRADPFRSLMYERSQVVLMNLRDDHYWSSTRIFLIAALTQDFTDVQALVFVRSGDQQVFVGIASPRAVRARLTEIFPAYEVAYRHARAAASRAQFEELVLHPVTEVTQMLEFRWREALADLEQPEDDIERFVGSGDIQEWLRGDLDTRSFSDGPLTTLRQYRILCHDRPYAALTSDRGRLHSVVSRDELAASLSVGYVERRLGGS